MSAYIKLSTLDYPRHIGDIDIDPAGIIDYAPVTWVDMPTFNPATQRCGEGKPVLIDSVWFMTWIVRDATEQELAQAAQVASQPLTQPGGLIGRLSSLLGA